MDPNVNPVHAPRHRVQVAKLDRVHDELKGLCDEGIIRPVSQPTEWLSNILVKEKPSGKLKICIDPSQTINKANKRPVYSIPTFLWPNGCYCYTQMPFGISSGPEEHQGRQHEFLDGLHGIINIADDICIFGCGDTKEKADLDHDRNLIALLSKCKDYDLRLSARKLQFKASNVTFMGHRLTNKGVEPDPTKVEAIKDQQIKPPYSASWACASILANFCPNLSRTAIPLRDLTKQDAVFA